MRPGCAGRARDVVIVMGVTVVTLVLLFPPFMVIDLAAAGTRHSGLGHHPIWRPPTPAMAEETLTPMFGPSPVAGGASLVIRVNRVLLVLEITAVVAGALVALATERRSRKRKKVPARMP